MRLLDSNIFIYARTAHPRASACKALIARAPAHPEWIVPLLVLLEITHCYRDNGAYARVISQSFSLDETTPDDLTWAFGQSRNHSELNDHILLATAHRLGASGIVSYDGFFDRQAFFPKVARIEP